MDDKALEALIENVACKTAKQVLKDARLEWQKDINLHQAQCSIGKYKKGFNFIYALIGGIVVAVFNWVIKKI